MELFTLLPMLLKVLPFAAIFILYTLWRRAAYVRDKVKEERDGFRASYELAGETAKMKEQEEKDVAAIENLELSGVVDAMRGVLRDPRTKG